MKKKKKPLFKLSEKTRKTVLPIVYISLFAVMSYKVFSAKNIYELLLFSIPAIYCVYATFGETTRSRFHQSNKLVLEDCKPKTALSFMQRYRALYRAKRYASPTKLLHAYALMDSGQLQEAAEYITKTEKAAFSTNSTKPIAAYLLFNIAFLGKQRREVVDAFEELSKHQESFTTDMNREKPSDTWYMCKGNYYIITKHYEEAQELFELVDTEKLKYNRDKAYYYYSRALICAGLGDKAGRKEYAQKATELASAFAAIKQLEVGWE
ncbi:MAG: hypothetical protein IJP01_06945 [Oscillospiraceae bacterium]|nr:hypothetical protein [Oscillospiraceae bacterium]